MPRAADPYSTRPVVGRAVEERTVYTGRRALLRNLAVLVGSSAVVAMTLLSVLRWKEAHRVRPSVTTVVHAPTTEDEVPVVAPAPVPAIESPAAIPAAVRAVTSGTAVASVTTATAGAKPAPSASAKRAKTEPKPGAASLDDLNREIRH